MWNKVINSICFYISTLFQIGKTKKQVDEHEKKFKELEEKVQELQEGSFFVNRKCVCTPNCPGHFYYNSSKMTGIYEVWTCDTCGQDAPLSFVKAIKPIKP